MEALRIDAFANYTFLSGLRCGPQGELAFVAAQAEMEENSYRRDLWIKPPQGEPLQLTADGKTGGFLWDGPHTLLFQSGRHPQQKQRLEAGEEFTAFYRLDIRGGEAKLAFTVPLAASLAEKVREGVYLLSVDWDLRFSKAYAMKTAAKEALLAEKKEEKDYQVLDELPFYFNGAGYVNKHRTALFLFEEESGKLTRLTKESFDVSSAHLSPDGTQLLFTGESYTTKRKLRSGVYRYDFATGETAQLLAPRTYSLYDALWWGEKVLLLATDHKRYGMNENVQFYTLEPATGEISLLAPYEEAVGSSVGSDCRLGGGREWVAQDGKLYFVATIRNASQVFCLEANGDIRPVYTQEGSVDCIDAAGGTLYFIGMQDMKLQELYAWDEAAQERVQLTAFNEQALAGAYVVLPEKLTFTNDGIDLDGWVLRPKDFDPQKAYPAILDIHGGPKTVYGEVFYHEMQYWANEGYFVFFCNPRGGDGKGNEFADIRGPRYGVLDYNDLMEFTDVVLAKYPQIDPTRVGMTGGSYGGFMANWIVGHTDRFAAVASQRSISNFISKCLTTDIGYYHNLSAVQSDPWNSPEEMWNRSPLKYADKCKTPTLFIQSDEDYRCWMADALQMFTALRMHGVPTRVCLFHGENHELSRSGKPKHRVRRLKEITNWFDHYLKHE